EPHTMSARDAILGRIRSAVAHEAEAPAPPVHELWPAGTWQVPADLAPRFFEELGRVQGEGRSCASLAEARQHIRELVEQLGSPPVALADPPFCHTVAAGLANDHVQTIDPTWDRDRLANFTVAILPAEHLLADTGSAILLPRSPAERLLCYLPTVAV